MSTRVEKTLTRFRGCVASAPRRWEVYNTYGQFRPEEVFPFLATYPEEPDRTYVGVDGRTYVVSMDSLRYFTFRNNPRCVACGIEGTVFLLQRSQSNLGRCHFNFYAPVEHGLLMMTKDHIVPKSCGGHDYLCNMQTMCDICNFVKDRQNLTPEQVLDKRRKLEIALAEWAELPTA